jgi:hypothetical protein
MCQVIIQYALSRNMMKSISYIIYIYFTDVDRNDYFFFSPNNLTQLPEPMVA